MQNRTLSLSLLIGAALTIPSLAMAAPTTNDMTPVDMAPASANNTQQTEGENAEGELLSTTPSTFEINEFQTISSSSASINKDNNQAAMTTEIEAVQVPQGGMQAPQESMQAPQESMQAPQESMQAPQESMHAPQEDMQFLQEAEQVPQKSEKESQETVQVPQTAIKPQS